MSPAIIVALLLISTAAVKSAHDGDEEVFPPQLEGDANENVEHRSEEQMLEAAFPGSCLVCKEVVSLVKKELGSDRTKDKIEELLDKACNVLKLGLLKSVCKMTVAKYGEKLIDAIANQGSPQAICAELSLC